LTEDCWRLLSAIDESPSKKHPSTSSGWHILCPTVDWRLLAPAIG